MKYEDNLFIAWMKRAIQVANVARGDNNTDFDSISPSEQPGAFTARGYSYCCGGSERTWEEIPLAYMILTDEEIKGEERVRQEAEAGRRAVAEMEYRRILAEEEEQRERETLAKLMDKYKPFAQG